MVDREDLPPTEPAPGAIPAKAADADPGTTGAEQGISSTAHLLEEAVNNLQTNPPSSLEELKALRDDMRPRIRRSKRTPNPDMSTIYWDTEQNVLDGGLVEKFARWTTPEWWTVAPESVTTFLRVATAHDTDQLSPSERGAVRQWNYRWGVFTDRTEDSPFTEDEFHSAQPQIRAALKITAELYEMENERHKHLPHPDPWELEPSVVRKYKRLLLAEHTYSVLTSKDWELYKDDRGFTYDAKGEIAQVPFVLSDEERAEVRATAGTTEEAFEKYKGALAAKLRRHESLIAVRQAAQALRQAEEGGGEAGAASLDARTANILIQTIKEALRRHRAGGA